MFNVINKYACSVYSLSPKICEDWVATCTALNIPLSKSDHPAMRKFLFENVTNGGAIPGFHQLQEKYLGNVYLKEKEALRKRLAKKPVAVIFDETPDVEGRCVLNILIAPLEKDESGRILAYLADTVFLEQCNHSTVSVSVVKCLQEYDIANEDVIVFDTDNAAYMKKAYTAALQSLFPNSLHVTCMAHIMNLIGDAFRRPFDQLNAFMLSFSQMFYHAGSRKRRYLQFMSGKHPTRQKATMAPNPCATRWNSWFSAVQYHSEHFKLYKEFIEMEIKVRLFLLSVQILTMITSFQFIPVYTSMCPNKHVKVFAFGFAYVNCVEAGLNSVLILFTGEWQQCTAVCGETP